jgi:DNA-binding NarL/FixJ family response regulator
VVSAFDDLPTITRVINLGRFRLHSQGVFRRGLLSAVRQVLAGNIFRPAVSRPRHARCETPVPPAKAGVRPDEIGLTDRQAQVLALMVRGLSNRDIAEQLGLSEGTVKIHATAVFKTLGVSSRTQALVAVARYGIDFESVF